MADKENFVSIIIPCREIDKYTRECIEYCENLNYDKYEILVLPDFARPEEKSKGKLRIIPTGKVKPAIKRNIGMKKARGNIYASIDSDAYPDQNWLRNGIKYFQNKDIALVGGPNLTPKNSNFAEQISGEILSEPIASGFAAVRYRKSKNRYVSELPTCNFLVKKEYATEFIPSFLTAEDSLFCFNISDKGKKILYAGDIIVYHHRRNSFSGHLKQMWIYGRDIAMLIKQKFSFDKIYYSLLSLWILYLIAGFILSFYFPIIRIIYINTIIIYIAIILIFSLRKKIWRIPFIFIGIILTHFAYGLGFIYGLMIIPEKTGLNIR